MKENRLKQRIFIFAAFLFSILTGFTSPVQAKDNQESIRAEVAQYGTALAYPDGIITSYHSDVSLEKNGKATITEKIIVFFPNEKHGIFRWIPNEVIVDGKRLKQPIDVKSVTYKALPPNATTTVFGGTKREYTSSKSSGKYTLLKIGDPDEYISGAYEYTISYTMKRAIRFQDGYNELYLNITGDQWEIPILKASATITPEWGSTEQKCFTGASGSTTSTCSIQKTDDKFEFKTTYQADELAQGLTVALQYPDNTFTPPSQLELLVEKLLPFSPILIPIIAFIYGFSMWKKYGKDIAIRAIPPIFIPTEQMEKENLSIMHSLLSMKPLQLATLAELIRIAEKGYLTISYENKEIKLLLDDKQLASLPKYLETQPASVQKLVMTLTDNFQAVTQLKDLKNIHTAIAEANKLASQEFEATPYITDQSEAIQKKFTLFSIFSFVAGVAPFIIAGEWIVNTGWAMLPIGFILTGVIFTLFAIGMLKRTKEGDVFMRDLLGLKKYIKSAEVKRLEFFNNPKKMVAHFEQILPYAIILKLDKQWTKEFGPILKQLEYQPSWMISDVPMYHALPRTYAAMSSQLSANMATLSTPPQSSGSSFGGGGGFSGGGSGGGGGGSW
ncbi:DUF2207 domain-containing protein [bacterium]|nr:DUF2207 domain-containing protein [bacterium]